METYFFLFFFSKQICSQYLYSCSFPFTGIPVARVPANPRTLQGVEAVIDKDACGSKLANEIDAEGFIILTDGGGK